LIRRDFAQVFESVDALICPTSPDPAFRIGERSDDPLRMYLADIFTIATNLSGNPGISLPCGFTEEENGNSLPIGLQLIGKPFDEQNLLKIAHAYEQSTEWHQRRPTLD
jgi:aspartyl-tRNA(Asn)/glutamyl-tRNA(Gln) amidotransferase subunit A